MFCIENCAKFFIYEVEIAKFQTAFIIVTINRKKKVYGKLSVKPVINIFIVLQYADTTN